MATLTGKLVSETYKALLKMIDNDILTETEKQISDGYGQGTGIFIDDNGFIRAQSYRVTGGSSSQFLKADGSLDGTGYLPVGTTTSAIAEGSRLYFTQARVLETILTGFVSTEGTVTAADSILSAINKIWWNIENGGGGGGGYVPYTGATQNLNLGTYGLISDFVQFNTTNSAIPTTAGTMSWNNTDGTADLILKGGNVTLQIGQENVVRVVNKTGANLTEAAYKVVRVRNQDEGGAQGQRLAVVLAQADSKINHTGILGLVTENITDNQEGFVTSFGEVRKIDTTGDLQGETWADGDVLWLSDSVAGELTNIEPETHPVQIGYVLYSHANNGKIFVELNEGVDELDELHDVTITDVQDEDVLFYDATEEYWINKNIYTAINATDVGKSLLGILNAEDTTPVTTKPRGIRINVDNTVNALEVGTQGYLPFYDETDFYIDSPVFTDGTQVIIGDDVEFASGNKLSVVGNLAVDQEFGYFLGANRILFRNNTTGELRFGTDVANDFTTFYANGIERARLNASGYLGIGLTAPTQPLHVKGVLAYPKIIIDNNSASGGGMFSAYQNGTETAMFGVSGAWLIDNSSDAAIVATKAGQGIQFYTNGSNSEKMGINSDGNVFVGQTPTYFAGATHLIVRGKTGAGFLGVQHYDMSIRGSINTFNSVFQVGTSTFHAVAVIVEDIERARFNSAGRMLLGTTTDNTVDKLQIDGSLIATAIKKSGGTSSQFLKADGSIDSTAYGTGSVTSVSATVPIGFAISGSPITTSGTLAISFASGYSLPTNIKQSNWDDAYTFVTGFPTQTGNAGKYLTTDGSTLSWGTIFSGVSSFNSRTGAVTLVGSDVINALGYTPVTNARTITINGVTQDLTTNITFNTGGVTSFNTRTGAVTLSSSDVTTALGFTPVTQARTLTINGQGYDLSADRAWTITPSSGMRNVTHYTATANQTTFTITGGYTVGLLDVFLNGVRIPESDFTATNGTTVVFTEGVKAGDIITAVLYTASATSGITGAGTANYLAKWSGSSAITNSLIFDNGTNVGIGTTTPALSSGNGLVVSNSSYLQLRLQSTSSAGMEFIPSTGNAYEIQAGDNNFFIYNRSVGSFRFYINGSGNVGIGTTSPAGASGTTLEINGGAGQGRLAIKNNATGSAASNGLQLGVDTGGGAFIEQRGANSLQFVTNGSSRFFISSDGTKYLGTTAGSRLQIDAPGEAIYSYTNNFYIYGIYNDSNSLAIESCFGGNIIFRAQPKGTSSAPYGAAERMRITSGGNLLIGTTSDQARVTIFAASGGAALRLNADAGQNALSVSGSGLIRVDYPGIGGGRFEINDNGTMFLRMYGNGTMSISGGQVVTSSDKNLKNYDGTIDNALNKILKLIPKYFYWKTESGITPNERQLGFFAQDVNELLGVEVANKNQRGKWGINDRGILAMLVKSTQEIHYNFETQAEKIARLETRVQILEAK